MEEKEKIGNILPLKAGQKGRKTFWQWQDTECF